MRITLLGTTQAVRDDGTAAALGGARLRTLLAVLAQRPGRAVPAARLVEEVWDGDPPRDAHGALQALVGRLRRALGRDAVASADGGYRLCAEPEDVDLHRFERLTAEGTRALADGDPVKAAALLDDALALWRGPALADLPGRTAAAARWEARRLDARRARLDAALALGRAGDATAELADLCAAHPLDEPLQALRIRALRDAGRPAQALAAYEEVRRSLAERLGTDPGPELTALHAGLLAPPAPPPVPAAAPARGNLRARLTSFVGREPELQALGGDLAAARLVTLLGPGGAGKTRLSQEAAEALGDRWPDGVWMAELAPVDDPAALPEAVLTALGGRRTVLRGAGAQELRAADRHGDDALHRLAEHCSGRRMLLLLDNCEHLVEAAALLAQRLLEDCPGLAVLATSREPLGVPGELLRPVDPLPDPVAVRLFADRGAAVRPGFRADADEATARAVAEICRRLDGLPLAVELAAARLRMLTPRQIADRLDDRFRLLTTGNRTALPRQQTLRAVVDWSWDLLTAAERAVLRRLSVFAGGCALAAAEAVCADPAGDPAEAVPAGPAGDPAGTGAPATGRQRTGADAAAAGPVPATEVAGLVGALVDKSLVVAEPDDGGAMRYRLLETVAEYAADRLDEAGERAAAERRHLVYHRELARAADPVLRGPEQHRALALFRREYENLRAALRRATALRAEHEVLCLVLSLAWYWQMRDLRSEARQWSAAAAALHGDPFGEPVRPAPPLAGRCTDGPPPFPPPVLAEARRQNALIRMAAMDHHAEDWTSPRAQEWLRRVVRTYEPPSLPQLARFPGSLAFFAVLLTGDGEDVRRFLDASVRTAGEQGDDWALAAVLQQRANLLANRAHWAGDALQDADRSLALFRDLGDAWGIAEALASRAEAHERRGDYAEAAAGFRAATGHAERLGAESQAALLRTRLAAVLVETGVYGEAEAILRAVVEAEGESNEALPAARLVISMLYARTGRTPEARTQLGLLAAEMSGDTLVLFHGMVVGYLAWLDVLDGRFAEALEGARAALDPALDRLSLMVAPQLPALHVLTAACALLRLGGPDRTSAGARLVGARPGLLPPGHVPTAVEREQLEYAERAGRAALGDRFEALRAEGGRLAPEEAAALVRAAGAAGG
ncbi:BTAD domain-containing putative transcriptional regulator [Streptomyces sp. NPDC047968]|uniref:BTAD domain-containing putative transcriptional regulator n=1 Tax=unclassified Streptomyces TaxID=2593676 RepID=UPI00341834D1